MSRQVFLTLLVVAAVAGCQPYPAPPTTRPASPYDGANERLSKAGFVISDGDMSHDHGYGRDCELICPKAEDGKVYYALVEGREKELTVWCETKKRSYYMPEGTGVKVRYRLLLSPGVEELVGDLKPTGTEAAAMRAMCERVYKAALNK